LSHGAIYAVECDQELIIFILLTLPAKTTAPQHFVSMKFFKYSPPQHCFCNCIWMDIDKEAEGFEPDKD